MAGDRITLAILFDPEPVRFGLRGDTYLWQEMREAMNAKDLPGDANEVATHIESAFQELTGIPMSTNKRSVHVERYSHGGISSGWVSIPFWREVAVPLLQQRFLSVTMANSG